MQALIHPTYFPNVSTAAVLAQATNVIFEDFDNYEKQTHRNRTTIYGANGSLPLSIPVSYSQKNRQLYKEATIANTYNWQNEHLKSLHSAYESSPFFEFYIDDLLHLYKNTYTYLIDFNYACFKAFTECLELTINYSKTNQFSIEQPEDTFDYRYLVQTKQTINWLPKYTQVFDDKHGYLSNLSSLDLLFNEGPNTLNFLEQVKLPKS